jgi:hypothetical protein
MLSVAESSYLLDLMKKDLENHIKTIDMVRERLSLISKVPTSELIDELCKRDEVVEYHHGDNTYFEIVKYDKPDRIINGYKVIPDKDRILVIKSKE